MKKRIASAFLALILVLTLVSCGKKPSSSGSATGFSKTSGGSTSALLTEAESSGLTVATTTLNNTWSNRSTTKANSKTTNNVNNNATNTTAQRTTIKVSDKKAIGVPSSYINTILNNIQLNQIGYATDSEKIAITNDITGVYYLVNAETNSIVYSAAAKGPFYDETNKISIYKFDFSRYNKNGNFYIHTQKGRSSAFTISAKPYRDVSNAMIKALYYQRCGTSLTSKHAGVYAHDSCHESHAVLVNNSSVVVDTLGGWHDAGDYGKYVVPANTSIFHMLYAYELFRSGVSDNLNIPESNNNVADILDEARYELEWMLKMQAPSGGVYHKVTTARFADTVMPEYDTAQQVLSQISLAATAGFAGSMAAAYRTYKSIDAAFANKCLAAAKKAYDFSIQNENMAGFKNISPVATGVYGDNNMNDEIYWAAAELFRATGEKKYEDKFKDLRERNFKKTEFGTHSVGGFGSISYYLSSNANATLKQTIKNELTSAADAVLSAANSDAYLISLSEYDYYWGSNMVLMNKAANMAIAAKINATNKYDNSIHHHVSYLLGRNILSKSYVTGFGTNPVKNPHHRPSQADGITEPVPGLVAGGPDDRLDDETMRKLYTKDNRPTPAACYVDNEWSYSTNEITIYWNSATFFITGYLNSK